MTIRALRAKYSAVMIVTASAVIAIVHAISRRGLSVIGGESPCCSSGRSIAPDRPLDRGERVVFRREAVGVLLRDHLVPDPHRELAAPTLGELRLDAKGRLDR